MIKTSKKFVCVLLVVVLCLTAIPLQNFVGIGFNAKASEYEVGNIVQFGSYPQSTVTDSSTVSMLSEQNHNWISYKYMQPDTRNVEDDFMKYADIDIDNNGIYDYRAVTFSKYRNRYAINYGSTVSYQDDNGYEIDKIYYFKYEPLNWRILDKESGLVFCEDLIDAQHYNKFLYWTGSRYKNELGYVNDWEISYIREWLNNDFYSVAFSPYEKDSIHTSTTQNIGYNNSYNYSDTEDKVFLLSYSDILNLNYGFSSSKSADTSRTVAKHGTDYAKCQGLYGGKYFLRSAGFSSQSDSIVSVNQDGSIDNGAYSHSWDNYGIRPALRVDLSDVSFVSEGSDEVWKKDKIKIEFRFADTKEIIDNSDQYIIDQQVGFNFSSIEYGHWYRTAENGVLYLEDFYFPLNNFKANWCSAFGNGVEYICTSSKTINAKAGDTIIVYMSTNDNQGSVTIKVTNGKSKNYGAHNTVSTIEGEIRNKAKELIEYIDDYILLINGGSSKNKNNVGEETLHKCAKSINNVSAKNKIYAVPPKANYEYALCYALAKVLYDKTEEKIDLGKINLDKSKEEIALNLTKKLINNFDKIEETVIYDQYKIYIKIDVFGKAFTGSYNIYNKKGNILYGPGIINSTQDTTKATLNAYFTAMSDLVNDMLKSSMSAIFTEISDVTGLTSFRKNELNNTVKNALSFLEKKGFGKVKDILMTGREIYIHIKDLASATSELTVSNLLNTEEKTRALYEIVFNNTFTSSKASEAAAKEIISKIESARKDLYNLLYKKLYGVNRDDASILTKTGNWIKANLLCPVDVEIYNSSGDLIAYVDTVGIHDEFLYCSEDVFIEVHGNEKFIYFPADKAITIKLRGTADGEMTYSLETLNNGKSIDKINYYNVPLTSGCEYSQNIKSNMDLSVVFDNLILSSESNDIYADEYLSSEYETAHIRVLYSSTEGGTVSGDMYYPKGSSGTLYAYSEEGYIFEGWYENEKCISKDEIYRFAAISDMVLEARFKKYEEQNIENEETIVLDRIILSEKELVLKQNEQENLYYIAIPSITNINVEWNSADPTIATVDENGLVKALSEGATIISAKDLNTNIYVQCRVVVGNESSCSFLGHEYKDWRYVCLENCETDGIQERSCLYCEYLETTIISAYGHDYASEITTPSTHTATGVMSFTCHCGDTYTEVIEKIAKHDYKAAITEPTCTKQGFTTYTCECGDSYVADYVDSNGHSHAPKITTPATHLKEGIMTYTCACGDSYTKPIAKLTEHNYNAVVTEPTCTEQGYTTYTCECGDSYVDDYVDATGHNDASNDGNCDVCSEHLCDHACHKTGITGFFWKIVCFFNRIFGLNKFCTCGNAHY